MTNPEGDSPNPHDQDTDKIIKDGNETTVEIVDPNAFTKLSESNEDTFEQAASRGSITPEEAYELRQARNGNIKEALDSARKRWATKKALEDRLKIDEPEIEQDATTSMPRIEVDDPDSENK